MPEQEPIQLDTIIASVLDAENRGESVDRSALLNAHPEHADALRDFFETHERMKSAAAHDSEEADQTLPPRTTDGETTIGPDESDPTSDPPGVGDKIRYFGDYELLEEIARGGMGVVFKARQLNLNRIVALKMILAGQFAGAEDIQRFYTEAEAAGQLDHPGIVPIFEIGEHSGQHYFSMAFVEGESLAQRIVDGPLPPNEAAELVKQISEAMAYAHERGVIHRDLKPANVLIAPSGQPKVTDFGLAKRSEADKDLTGTGQILGTPAYMPPEQAAGKVDGVGPIADVYSLGAILYCLLTGRPPFQAASPMDTLLQVLEQEPVPPRALNPLIDRDLETICLKCIEKDISKRYQSAHALGEELSRYLNHEPILARRAGRIEKTIRWCRRKPALASLFLAALIIASLLLLGGPLIAYQQNRLATQARLVADQQSEFALEQARLKAAAEEQADLARQNQLAAEAESRRSKQILELLTTSFERVNPSRGARADLLAIDVLRDVQNRLNELSSPLDKAELLDELAICFAGAGDTKAAIDCRRQYLELIDSIHGERSWETAWAKNRLALALRGGGRVEDQPESLRLYQEAIEIAEQIPEQANSPMMVRLLNDISWAYQSFGKMPEALQYRERVVTLGREIAPQSGETITAMSDLAYALESQGDKERARSLLDEAHQLALTHHGERSMTTIGVATTLAESMAKNGESDSAFKLLEGNLVVAEESLGEGHSITLGILEQLSRYHFAFEQFVKAIDFQDELLRRVKTYRGEDSNEFQRLLNDRWQKFVTRASQYMNQQFAAANFSQALPIAQQLLALQENHRFTTVCNPSLMTALTFQGLGIRPIELLEKTCTMHLAAENYADAELASRELLETIQSSQEDLSQKTPFALTALGDSLVGQNRWDKAKSVLQRALQTDGIDELSKTRCEQMLAIANFHLDAKELSFEKLEQLTVSLQNVAADLPPHLAWISTRAQKRLDGISRSGNQE